MIDIQKLVNYNRYLINHFVIGYFALFIIYGSTFIDYDIYSRVIFSIVASYVLFIPAGIMGVIFESQEMEDPKIYRFFYYRMFPVLFILSYFQLEGIHDIGKMFFTIAISDTILGASYYVIKS